ncbi:hypothetical protein B0H63DRAFT_561414 [Podospora didyma]|uniref:Uncharacterized protein n=1 Tax=Podospora didyma TaxID=330526 RepID=A0AAE0NI01_9PEZI|nr:hypothetical protein B0H63DRAFT_561414 [Podospora didyma]
MRQCLEPRDKVYALYALSSDRLAFQPPDYTKPVPQVMQETSATLMNLGWGTALVNSPLSSDRLSNTGYASWVLDFASTSWPLHSAYLAGPLEIAESPRIEADAQSGILCLGEEKIPEQLSEFLQELSAKDSSGMASKKLARVCYRSPTFKNVSNTQLLEHLTESTRTKDITKTRWPLLDTRQMMGMAIVKAGGRLGICPDEVMDDDIETQVDRVSHNSSPHYRMVGIAYFEGLSDDKGVDLDAVVEAARRPLVELEIR